jgi:hypothetical protein
LFEYSRYVDKLADIFFIDTAHTNPGDWDIIQYGLKNLKSGGLLCGHDYSTDWPDVVENVKKLEDMLGQNATLYPETSLWSFVVDSVL